MSCCNRRAAGAATLLAGWLIAGRCGAIANGTAPTDREFARESPWVVVLVHDDAPGICTGSLVSPRFVLTAAHCASDDLIVLYGNRSRESARRVAVREAIRHPKFTSQPNAYDLALLRLARPIRVRTVPIASRAESWDLVRPGRKATILGWGSTITGVGNPDIVLRATIRFTGLGIQGTHIFYDSALGGPCGGDSGGPLIVTGQDGQSVLVGVASITGGNLCATGGGVAGYTDVAALLDFVREHVPELPERLPPVEFDRPES